MNKTAIRNFAVWARNKLIADVSYQAGLMGILKDGISPALQQSTDNIEFYDIGASEPYAIRDEQIRQRKSLVDIIKAKEKDSNYVTAYNSVIEEVAYTWFNRLIAVRFMEVNDYLPAHVRVLSSDSGKQEPDIVTTPFDAELCFGEGEDQEIIQMKNENKLDEVFRILFMKQCRELSLLLPRLFEGTNDYTELLLNLSFIDQEGVVYHLVHDIPEDDFNVEKGGQVEIIGWLYQYYNAELKDETFALLKNKMKVTKERIPSVTQLFTPDWIVRYMVENSLGRLWIEGHPNNLLKASWKYYLEEAEQENNVKDILGKIQLEHDKLNPEDIKIIDPCMGSGHILVYAFDVLMQIYESAGYTQRDAAKSILENNIYGLDIDDRAAQLAYFAVMMKARQYNRRILDGHTDCYVYAIKESNDIDRNALVKIGDDLRPLAQKLLDIFVDAKEYGSILSVDLTLDELDALEKRLDEVDRMSDYGTLLDMMYASILCSEFDYMIRQARVMVQRYDAVITNPPYMGSSGMDEKLTEYLKEYFPDSKGDFFAVFIEKCSEYTKKDSYFALITQPSFVSLSSFENLRKQILASCDFISMLHMGRGIFGIDFGSVSFVLRKNHISNYIGSYFKLYERTFQYIEADDIEKIYLEAKNNKSLKVFFKDYDTKTSFDFNATKHEKGIKVYYESKQEGYILIQGIPIAYWATGTLLSAFKNGNYLGNLAVCRNGLKTGDNDKFIKLWWEVFSDKCCLNATCVSDAIISRKKWFPYNKGGDSRKWYGNEEYVLNWENQGEHVIGKAKAERRHVQDYPNEMKFAPSCSWSLVSSGCPTFRYKRGNISDIGGMSFYNCGENIFYYLGFCNSPIASFILQMLAPTINYQAGDISRLPMFIDDERKVSINRIVEACVEITQDEWNSFETAWDFKKHPLV